MGKWNGGKKHEKNDQGDQTASEWVIYVKILIYHKLSPSVSLLIVLSAKGRREAEVQRQLALSAKNRRAGRVCGVQFCILTSNEVDSAVNLPQGFVVNVTALPIASRLVDGAEYWRKTLLAYSPLHPLRTA